jgi:hypothetical protein
MISEISTHSSPLKICRSEKVMETNKNQTGVSEIISFRPAIPFNIGMLRRLTL